MPLLPNFLLNLTGQIAQAMLAGNNLIRLLLLLLVVFMLDRYLFRAIKPRIEALKSKKWQWFWKISCWVSTVLLFASFVSIMLYFGVRTLQIPWLMNLSMAIFFMLVTPRLFLLIIFGLEDLVRIGIAAVRWVHRIAQPASNNPSATNADIPSSVLAPSELAPDSTTPLLPGRRKFIGQLALGVAAVPFASVLYGVTKGKYNYTLHRLTLRSPQVPPSFDGFTLLQISDLHTGSFDSRRQVTYGVDMIRDQGADLVAFTGDMVNNYASEVEPWMNVFDRIEAREGVFSTLGNHDYGDYGTWSSIEDKIANLQKLKQHHASMGYRLLLNEHVTLTRNGEKLVLAGVENWGLPPFPQYGDLNQALAGTERESFRILMSHDPSHFDAQVVQSKIPVHLTLSGHTHGMQAGIEIPGFKWSPVKYRYPRWAGMYESQGKYLYVNRGFGYLAFPGRVGIWPEVTLIRLEHGPEAIIEERV